MGDGGEWDDSTLPPPPTSFTASAPLVSHTAARLVLPSLGAVAVSSAAPPIVPSAIEELHSFPSPGDELAVDLETMQAIIADGRKRKEPDPPYHHPPARQSPVHPSLCEGWPALLSHALNLSVALC